MVCAWLTDVNLSRARARQTTTASALFREAKIRFRRVAAMASSWLWVDTPSRTVNQRWQGVLKYSSLPNGSRGSSAAPLVLSMT